MSRPVVSAATELSPLEECDAELSALRDHPHNVLIEGSAAITESTLALVFEMHGGTPIVLRNPGALGRPDQERLLESLRSSCPPRVISISGQPLFAQVEAGRFDVNLYYYLNVVLLRLDSRVPH